MRNIISTIAELVSTLESIKANGQYASVQFSTSVRLNKFPTDGSERVRVDSEFADGLTKVSRVSFHWNDTTYSTKMAEALGVDEYTPNGANRQHIVANLLMRYISTNRVCLIALPEDVERIGYRLNGEELSEEQESYRLRYTSKAKKSYSEVKYLTIGVQNLRELSVGGNTYVIDLKDYEAVA